MTLRKKQRQVKPEWHLTWSTSVNPQHLEKNKSLVKNCQLQAEKEIVAKAETYVKGKIGKVRV